MSAIRDAIDVTGRAQALTNVIEKFVVRGADGKPITDKSAVKLAKESNGLYVAKSKRELIRVLRADSKIKEMIMEKMGRKVDPEEIESELLAQLDELPGTETQYLIPALRRRDGRTLLVQGKTFLMT